MTGLSRPPRYDPAVPPGRVLSPPSTGLAVLSGDPLLPDPQWVITGARLPGGGFRVLASNTLRAAAVTPAEPLGDPDIASWPAQHGCRIVINRQLKYTALIGSGFYLIDGGSYAACLAGLFAEWAPETTGRPELTAHTKEPR